MASYKILTRQIFSLGEYSIVPIRWEDRYKIMKWRNEQMYHLRQKEPLTEKSQNNYFTNVINKLFDLEKPDQILFSYLKGDNCIGYGGLVHINWTDRNSEISFLINTSIGKEYFEIHWNTFIELLEKVAWGELNLHKIYTYAFDLRPLLYSALEKSGFELEAELKEHCYFKDKFISVKIHSKIKKMHDLRPAKVADLELTYSWANNPQIRFYSFNKQIISVKEHEHWYLNKIANSNCEYYILEVNEMPAGSIRFDIEEQQIAKINYLLDPIFFGKGLGTYLLDNGLKFLKKKKPSIQKVYGLVFNENLASIRIFEKLSFEKVNINNTAQLKFEKFI